LIFSFMVASLWEVIIIYSQIFGKGVIFWVVISLFKVITWSLNTVRNFWHYVNIFSCFSYDVMYSSSQSFTSENGNTTKWHVMCGSAGIALYLPAFKMEIYMYKR
jgi:hypothetical protein